MVMVVGKVEALPQNVFELEYVSFVHACVEEKYWTYTLYPVAPGTGFQARVSVRRGRLTVVAKEVDVALMLYLMGKSLLNAAPLKGVTRTGVARGEAGSPDDSGGALK
jgi:hypothetical protein